jgi:CrcB protein
MMNVLWVFIGGGLGAAARYWLTGLTYRWVTPTFPAGVLVVNVLGCFLIGAVMSVFENRFAVNPAWRVFVTIGILGGFTTFSSFSYETIALLRDQELFLAGMNVLANVVLCLIGTWIGLVLGRLV